MVGENVCGLTLCDRVTHIYDANLTIFGLDNGLSPGRRQAIIWTTAGILLMDPWEQTSVKVKILTFSLKKTHLKVSSVEWQPFCLGFNVLMKGIQYPFKGSPVKMLPAIDCFNIWQHGQCKWLWLYWICSSQAGNTSVNVENNKTKLRKHVFFHMVFLCLLITVMSHWARWHLKPLASDCLPNHLFRCTLTKTSNLCITGLCEGNPPATGRFPSQRASNTENVSVRWHQHVC